MDESGRWEAQSRMKPKLSRVESRRTTSSKPSPRTKLVPKAKPTTVKPAKEHREERKSGVSQPEPVAPSGGGHYELNPLMTRMVESELKNIMIKVWQELPDNPADDAEKLVVDKLRNKAGDDLRNVLGLNISKRLLNVYNPLYVKIQFTGKPEKAHLSAFLKKYNFNAFKRIENNVNTFAAQVRTIADFDRICTVKDIRCGNIKVTVNPCYRFTKCPPNLKTHFDGSEATVDDMMMKELNKSAEKSVSANEHKSTPSADSTIKQIPKEGAKAEQNVKDAKRTENINTTKIEKKTEETMPKKEEPKVVNDTKVTNAKALVKENKETITKKEEPKIDSKSTKEKAPEKESIAKKENPKVVDAKPMKAALEKDNKAPIAKQQNPKVVEDTKAVKAKTNDKVITPKTDESKIVGSTKKPEVTKAKAPEKEITPKKDATNTATKNTDIKQPIPKVQDAKPKTTQKVQTVKAATKHVQATQKPIQTKQTVGKKVNQPENDFDELDDHDILALISGGIVLDECSGSDEE